MTSTRRVLLVSGSLRTRSTNAAALRSARSVAPDNVAAELYGGMGGLPHFNPDDDAEPLHPAVADLRLQIRSADAVLFSTPEYAGALPGSFKNLLDWTVGDHLEGSIYRKPVAWINASPRGAVNAHQSLRQVLGYTGASIIEQACIEVPVTDAVLGGDGLVTDPAILQDLAASLETLAAHADGRQPDISGQS
jgi:NAD(P)H-dependent FMN reductase